MIVRLRLNYDSVDFIDGFLYTYFIKTNGNKLVSRNVFLILKLSQMAYLCRISVFFVFPPKPLVGVRFSHPLLEIKLSRFFIQADLESFFVVYEDTIQHGYH